jgi:DNA invertase Pin-like site-specific DNA recombinase
VQKSGAEFIPMKYGYARVSTDGQSIDAQVRQASDRSATRGPTPGISGLVG